MQAQPAAPQDITTNDPFSEGDPFEDVRAPLEELRARGDTKHVQLAEDVFTKHAKAREAMKAKYTTDRVKFQQLQGRTAAARVLLEEKTRQELAKVFAKAEKAREAELKKAARLASKKGALAPTPTAPDTPSPAAPDSPPAEPDAAPEESGTADADGGGGDGGVALQDITTNDPFTESDPFVATRAPLADLRARGDARNAKAADDVLAKHAKAREAMKAKYTVERKKFQQLQGRTAATRVLLEGKTKQELAKIFAKAEKLYEAEQKKAARLASKQQKKGSASTPPPMPKTPPPPPAEQAVHGGALAAVAAKGDAVAKHIRVDLNGDGVLTEEERKLAAFDANGDGVLDVHEQRAKKAADEKAALAHAMGGVVTHEADATQSLLMAYIDEQVPGQGFAGSSLEYAQSKAKVGNKAGNKVGNKAGKKQRTAQEKQRRQKLKEASARSLMLQLRLQGKDDEAAEVELAYKFSESDPGWADAFFQWLKDRDNLMGNYLAHTHTALGESFVYALPDDKPFSLAIIGDWGAGNSQSIELANQMVAKLAPDLFLHLGDVYYAGTAKQFQDFYIAPLLKAFRVSKPLDLKDRVWTLPGNHCYYAGGQPFFDTCAQFGSHRGSYFCLTNEHWALIGLDTSLDDANPIVTAAGTHCTKLPKEQLEWAKKCVDDAKSAGKGVIFASHHMLFSQHETTGSGRTLSYTNEELYAQFGEAYIAKIDFWFWGHEHAWTRWAPYRSLERGYLLGNGGVPVMLKDNMYAVKPVPGQKPPQMLSKPPETFVIHDSLPNVADMELWCNGLYQLCFDGPSLRLQYYELHNTHGLEWSLDAVVSEREAYTMQEGKLSPLVG